MKRITRRHDCINLIGLAFANIGILSNTSATFQTGKWVKASSPLVSNHTEKSFTTWRTSYSRTGMELGVIVHDMHCIIPG